jgi:hypothetical protein
VSIVNLVGGPGVGASGVCENGHCALLQDGGDSASVRGSAPSSDGAGISGVVSCIGRSHADVTSVTVGGYVGKAQSGNVVGVTLVSVVHEVCVPDKGGEGTEGACAAVCHRAVSGSTQRRVRSYGSTSAVGGSDGLRSTDQRGSTGVRV